MGYWGFSGGIADTLRYWVVLGCGALVVLGCYLGYMGVLEGIVEKKRVLWGNVGNYGVLQVLRGLGGTGGYRMVLLGTNGYWKVLDFTGGTGGY